MGLGGCGGWEGSWFVSLPYALFGKGDWAHGPCRRGVGKVWWEGEIGECEVGLEFLKLGDEFTMACDIIDLQLRKSGLLWV